MKKGEVVSTPQETNVKNPAFSVVAGKEFMLDLNNDGTLAAVLITGAAAACCIYGGSYAAVRLGVLIVDRLIK